MTISGQFQLALSISRATGQDLFLPTEELKPPNSAGFRLNWGTPWRSIRVKLMNVSKFG